MIMSQHPSASSQAANASVAPPRPLAPLSGDVADRSHVTFTWTGAPGATGYTLEVASDRQFARGAATFDAGSSTEFTLLDAFPLTSAPLFWRVRAETASGHTRWSPYGRFYLGTDDAVDAYRAQREAARLQARRERLRRQTEESAARDLVPPHERSDLTPEDAEVALIGIAMLGSFLLILLLLFLLT